MVGSGVINYSHLFTIEEGGLQYNRIFGLSWKILTVKFNLEKATKYFILEDLLTQLFGKLIEMGFGSGSSEESKVGMEISEIVHYGEYPRSVRIPFQPIDKLTIDYIFDRLMDEEEEVGIITINNGLSVRLTNCTPPDLKKTSR